jgi:ankyrin repeat protein
MSDAEGSEEEEEEKLDPCVLVSDFYAACKAGDSKQAKELQDYEVPPFYSDGNWTPLHWACRHGMVEVVERLLEDGAHQPYLDAVEESLRPPPEPVVKVSSDEEDDEEKAPAPAEPQIKFGTVNSIPSAKLLKNTPLHWAAFGGHLRIVWLLMKAGYRPSDVDDVGNSPLHLAAAGDKHLIVRALVAGGADALARNDFNNAPGHLATSERVKKELFEAETDPPHPSTRQDLHEANLSRYDGVKSTLEAEMQVIPPADADYATLEAQRKTLAEALQTARDACIVNEVIVKGAAALRRSEARCALREQVDVVEGGGPTVTQRAYARDVNKLERLRREAIKAAEEGAELIEGGDPTGGLGALMEEADALGYRSRSEYWLYQCCTPLDAIDCADESSVRSLERLEKAIAEAVLRKAQPELLARGQKLFACRSAELELKRSMRELPSPKLPIDDPPADYWSEEDQGHIDETEEYPLPPEGGDYVWIPSEILGTYREAALRVERALDEAKTCEGNAVLVEEGQLSHEAAAEVMKQLERKDEEDKATALAAVEKVAKKYKKAMKKK